jgi:hypothetical protein
MRVEDRLSEDDVEDNSVAMGFHKGRVHGCNTGDVAL